MLEKLLRLRRRRCDERRRYLAELENLAERLRAGASRLHAEIAESGSGSTPGDAGALYDRQNRLHRSLAEIEHRIAAAAVEVATAERELSRLELAWAQRGALGAMQPFRQASSGGARRRN